MQNFTMKRVFKALLQDPDTSQIIGYTTSLQDAEVNFTVDLKYAMGGEGNPYIGKAFADNLRGTATANVGKWNSEFIGAQSGSGVSLGAVSTRWTESGTIEIASDVANTSYTAIGTAGEEIKFVQILDSKGNVSEELTQAGAVAAGVFTYTSGTKLLTFNTGDYADGTKIRVAYDVTTAATAQRITMGANSPKLVRITFYGIATDICGNGDEIIAIEGLYQLDGNINLATGSDADPATQSLSGEFVTGCEGSELATITIYSEADLT